MPFEALVLCVEQVSVLDAADAGVPGQPGHGGETVGHAQWGGVDVEVDVAVRHQQARAERAYEVGFSAHRAPDGLQVGVADDVAGALLVGGRNFEDVVHIALFEGL